MRPIARRRVTQISFPFPRIATPEYRALVLADSPVAYWRLGESSGVTALPAVGTLNGTYQGSPTLGVAAAAGVGQNPGSTPDTAIGLNGTTHHVTIPDNAVIDLGNGPLSYECWYKRLNSTRKGGALIAKGTGTPFLIVDDSSLGSLEWYARSVAIAVSSSVPLTDTANWHHIVGTKSAGNAWKLYLDGSDVTTGSGTPATTSNTAEMNLGRDNAPVTPGSYLAGYLDDVAIYNYVLTPSQVSTHYAAGLTGGSAPPPPPPPPPPPTGTLVPATAGALRSAILAAPASGATLLLRGGTHLLTGVDGIISTSKSLTIENYPGETPIVTWSSTTRQNGLYFTGGPNIVRGIRFESGSGIFHDSNGSALLELDGGDGLLVENCVFVGHPNLDDHQQFLYQRFGTNITVRGCTFTGNGSQGFGFHQYPADPVNPIALVENCTFTDFAVSGAVTSDSRVTVRNSVFNNNNIAVQLRNSASGSVITGNSGTGNSQELQINSPVTGVTNTGNTWT